MKIKCGSIGYKVFKKLKELRLEKKAKTKELNCIYALTKTSKKEIYKNSNHSYFALTY